MIADLIKIDATLTRVTGNDSPSTDFTPGTDTEDVAVKCWYEQNRRGEDTTNGDRQVDTWSIFLLPSTACSGSDRLTIGSGDDALVLEFDGPPWPAVNPRTGAESHIEATGHRVQ